MVPTRSVPILRFRSGAVTCAVAARGVASLGTAVVGARQLSDVLGLPAREGSTADRWLLRLDSGGRSLEVLIEGPVAIEELSQRDVLEPPRALVLAPGHPILGFARRGDEVIVLLNIPSLVELGS